MRSRSWCAAVLGCAVAGGIAAGAPARAQSTAAAPATSSVAAPAGAATSILRRDPAEAPFAARAPRADRASLATLAPLGEPTLLARISGRGGAIRGALNAERARVMLQ